MTKPSDTTKELMLPIDEVLGQASLDLAMLARRLRNRLKTVPGGQTSEAVGGVVIRMLAASDVLREQTKLVNRWPKAERER